MIDAGGARMRERDQMEDWGKDNKVRIPGFRIPPIRKPEPTVTVHVTETHDGEPCDCIEQDMVLKVGQEVELTHTCHDGRVDKVVARVTAINIPGPEHGTVEVR